MTVPKAQVGDIVHVRGTVNEYIDGDYKINFGPNITCWVPESAVCHIEARPICVGNRVIWRGSMWDVKGTSGNKAWLTQTTVTAVNWDTADLSELVRPPL